MREVTSELSKEHQLILKYVALMEQYIQLGACNDSAGPGAEYAAKFVEFVAEFADDYHHSKEELILFQYLDTPKVLTHCSPLPHMLFEHDEGRDHARGMREALVNGQMPVFVRCAESYAALLRAHIYKEDNVLYPMAEEGLSLEDKGKILAEYRLAEANKGKVQLWQKYEALLAEFSNEFNAISATEKLA